MGGGVLAIVERGYRGAVEKQYFDCLCLATELHRQLGGLHLLLRGTAVSYAVCAGPVPPLRLGGRLVATLPDPRGGLRRLLAAGVRVWVDTHDLAACGIAERAPLLEGVEPEPPEPLASRWGDYRLVVFL